MQNGFNRPQMQNNGSQPAYQRSGPSGYNNQPKPMSGGLAGGAGNQNSAMASGGGGYKPAQQQQQQQAQPPPQPQAAQPRPSPPNGTAMMHHPTQYGAAAGFRAQSIGPHHGMAPQHCYMPPQHHQQGSMYAGGYGQYAQNAAYVPPSLYYQVPA
ncbi:hypothetical protein MRX96_031170 [Rhipicephalus microplus]